VKARVAVTLHEPWIPFTFGPGQWLPAAWQRIATGWMVSGCDHVIVTTERRRRQVQRLMFPSGSQVKMIPVGSNIPFIPADREETRRRLGASPHETLFVTFGTTLPHRDFCAAYRCLKRLRDDGVACRLVNVGKVTNEARLQRLNRLEAELGLQEVVGWTGYQDAATVSSFLQAADVYLGPDRLGVSTRQTSLMAGLLHRLPVVGWRGPETDPLLERSGAIVFSDAGDEKGMAEAMKAAAVSPAVRATMGARARELFDHHFSWRQIAQRTLKLYSRK
jgi:glycosyltransferase involved in cell wall biosynthesis